MVVFKLLLALTVCTLFSHVFATCGCVCSDSLVAQPYIVELQDECGVPEGPSGTLCANVNCAKCGTSLECYVDSGDSEKDEAVCAIINEPSKFCSEGKEDKKSTVCNQKCFTNVDITCHPGESWGECPAVLGGNDTLCKFGASGGPAELSNFASYKICLNSEGSTCSAEGSCLSGGAFECKVTTDCSSSEAIMCVNQKCDDETSSDGTCPCA